MRIYYDTEFLENGSTIRLISIGMIREDGKSRYRVNFDYGLMKDIFYHDWLKANVAPFLPYEMTEDGVALNYSHPDFKAVMSKESIAKDVKEFVLDTPNPELWAYYSAYDHVALCQLFGRMVDLPTGFPMFSHDLKSLIVRMGVESVPEQSEGHHNALSDAIWNKETYEYLHGYMPCTKALRALRTSDEARNALQDSFDRGSRD